VTAPFAHANGAAALVPPFFAPGQTLPAAFVSEFHDLGAQVGKGVVPGPGLVVLHRGGASNPVVFAMSTAYMLGMLIVLLGLTFGAVRLVAGARKVARRLCWDGGLPRLLPGMTYTATGFSNPVRVVFDAVFHPSAPEETVEVAAVHFRTAVRRSRVEEHLVERFLYGPVARGGRVIAGVLAGMHHGRINTYAGYVLLTLLVFLALGRLL
jgi:hydrogenase-4 component B